MVPSSLGLNRWLLGPKACARWSRSPPLDRLPPQGVVMPPLGAVMVSLVPMPRAFLCRRAKSDVQTFRIRTVSIAT